MSGRKITCKRLDYTSETLSMLFAYTEKQFVGNYQTTIFDNYAVSVKMDQKRYTVNLFDTAGQEDYAHLRVLSYPQTDVFLLCFSLVDPQSLADCQNVWMPEIRKYTNSTCPVLLIGTKEDLLQSTPVDNRVDFKSAMRAATEMGCIKFLPCSSLTLWGLKRVFDEAIFVSAAQKDGTLDIHKGSENGDGAKNPWLSSFMSCCHPL